MLCLWSDRFEFMAPFMVFILWIDQSFFFFSLVVNF